ncbi:hypothetical protein D5086_014277 [Populus alba]|uniref:Uncharacterized protein n=1 Tax=Populus alba TaxID=43335 RepID=A0ACC4BYA0_POPAL
MEFNMLIRDLMRDLVKQVGSGLSFQVTNIRPKLSNNEEYLQEMDRVLAAEAKTLRLTDFKLDHVFANTAAGSDNKENVGSPESMVLGLEFNNLSIIKNECEEEGDPTIMREGNVWSPECPSINEIAASAEIFDILEYVCHVYKLPLALTWILEPTRNSEGKNVLRVEDTACYVNDLGAAEFVEICAEFDLEEGQGVAGKALLSDIYFVPDVSELDPADYPFVYEAWEFGLHGAVAIKLRSTYRSSVDYILEFFLPSKMREISEKQLLVNKILSTLQKSCRNSWIVCGMDLNVADVVSGVTAAEMSDITLMPNSGSSPSASNVDGSNTNNIMGWNMLSPVGDLVEIYETDEKENGESKAILEPASSADKEMVNLDCSKGILSINNGNKSEV